jgi:hypothetical protein
MSEVEQGRRAAIAELLEKTGAESLDEVLSAYEEYEAIQEAVSTEADRANARAERLLRQAKATEKSVKEWALRYALRERNFPSDRLDDAIALADTGALSVDGDGNVSGVADVVKDLLEPRPWLTAKLEVAEPGATS